MIPKPSDTNQEVPVNEIFHVQTDDELTEKELKQIKADDQAIQTILLGLPEDIYAVVDTLHQDQPSFNQNYMQQPMPNPEDITDPTTAMNMALALMAKAFNLNYSTPTNNNQRISSNPRNRQIAQPGINISQDRQMKMVGESKSSECWNQNGQIGVPGNANLVAARAKGNAAGQDRNQIRCYTCRGVANLQQASTSGTQTDRAPVYDSDGSTKVHDYENCDDNEIFNMFTQEEQYTELLDPIPKEHQVTQNDNNIISEITSVEQSRETVEHHPVNFEETRALYHSLYQNLAIEVEKVNSSHEKMKQLNKEIKPANYTKINHLLGVFVSQTAKLREELYFSNDSKTAKVSKSISIPNEEFSDDTTPSVARKFLNEVKSTIVTLQHVVKHRMTLETHNWSSSAHQELHKIIKDQNFPIVNQVDAKVQNFEIHFLKEATKFVGDFKSLAKEADESLAKHKALELEIKRLLRAIVSQDIISVVQKNLLLIHQISKLSLNVRKNTLKTVSLKRIMNMRNFGMIDTHNLLSQKLENENVELEFQVLNYARENAHLKTIYKNQFDSIFVSQTQTKTIISTLQNELQNTFYKNAKLRAQLFKKVSDQKDNTRDTSVNTKFAKQSIMENLPKVGETYALSKPVTSNSISTPQEYKVIKNDKVIALGMFRINPFKICREAKHVPNKFRASARSKPITISKPSVITKKDVNSDSNGLSSTGIDKTKTRRPQPRRNTKNDRVLSASKSSQRKNKEAAVEEHHSNLLPSHNNKHMSLACNNIKLDSHNVISKVVCAMCKQCLIFINHDECLHNYVNGKPSRGKKQKANVSVKEKQKKHQPKVKKTKKAGLIERLATPKPRKSRFFLRWSPTGRLFDPKGKIIKSSELESQLDYSNGYNAFTSNTLEPKIKRFPNSTSLLGRNNLVSGLPKFKYHKEHLCPSCEQEKSKRASHPPKPVLNSRQRLHLLHMDLCGPMRIASINGKSLTKPYELINGRKPDISFLYVFGALCYPKNDREDIGKLGAKDDIEFFIGYSADSCTYRVYNRRRKKIIETINVSFDKLSVMDFEQRSLKPGLQSMTSGQISSGLDLTYASSIITTQQPTEGELDLLLEAMYDDYIDANGIYIYSRTAPTPVNSSSHSTNIPITSHDVDESKDHPLEQVLGEPSQPVLTRHQHRSDGDMCMYALTVSIMEPKNVKEAMIDPAWIESIQDEILQLKRMDVWVLVPATDNISPLTLKWIFKNKHDKE
uniref:Retroviral polymerase SH3-like domain-containing protein n=1 Tax=Tanacetum cinerariifolium TaxID=118510 RepID=A0A6L2MHY4_TANCI|nr:hypothetical protein [Tanacetum cinerariifolium]